MWTVLLLVGFPVVAFSKDAELKLANEWKSIDFDFPSDKSRRDALDSGEFIPGNAVPIDVDIYYSEYGDFSKFKAASNFIFA